jgi:hypothetical protein
MKELSEGGLCDLTNVLPTLVTAGAAAYHFPRTRPPQGHYARSPDSMQSGLRNSYDDCETLRQDFPRLLGK